MTQLRYIFLITLLSIVGTICQGQIVIPQDISCETIYLEKFEPILTKDFSKYDFSALSGEDSIQNMSEFIELQRVYNKILYREFNSNTNSIIKGINMESYLKPIYIRDFKESADSSIRYIIRNDFKLMDIYQLSKKKQESYYSGGSLKYYIYDKKLNISYDSYDNIGQLVGTLNYVHSNCTEMQGKDSASFQGVIEPLLERRRLYYTSNSRSQNRNSANSWFYAIAFLVLIIIGNAN